MHSVQTLKQDFAKEKKNTWHPLCARGGIYHLDLTAIGGRALKKLGLIAALLALGAASAVPADEDRRQIAVTGTGVVEAAPDMAMITLGVTGQDEQAAAAMAAVSASVAQVLERLDRLGIAPRDIQTRDLNLSPVWSGRGSSQVEPARITGFVASNRVLVRVRDLETLGGVLDAVIAEGANDFGGLQFMVQEPEPLIKQARAAAVADAIDRARQLAQAAGVELGPVQSIADQDAGGPRPMARMAEMAMSDGGAVPVAPGELSFRHSVSMVFAIAQQ